MSHSPLLSKVENISELLMHGSNVVFLWDGKLDTASLFTLNCDPYLDSANSKFVYVSRDPSKEKMIL